MEIRSAPKNSDGLQFSVTRTLSGDEYAAKPVDWQTSSSAQLVTWSHLSIPGKPFLSSFRVRSDSMPFIVTICRAVQK
jgi:hypothetical protein